MVESSEPLTDAERAALLSIARGALRAAVAGAAMPEIPLDLPTRLHQPAGVFVSLHGPELRGCIGNMAVEASLAALTASMAAAAATRDPRFPPIRPEELDAFEIEVSILTTPWPVAPGDIDPMRHGVVLELGRHRAVLLPQVARRHGWDRESLLGVLCEKAGLAADAWRDSATTLLAFTVTTVTGRV